jgi:predicted HTH domain antitoxin
VKDNGVGAFGKPFRYPESMQHVTIALPDELLEALTASGEELSRAALEALSLEAYRTRRISAAQLRRLLGLQTRMQVDAFLKEHGVELEYGMEDLERDRKTHNQLGL